MTLLSCRCCGGWHSLDKPWPHNCISHWPSNDKRSSLPHPNIICDTPKQEFMSHADGKIYDSKSAYRRSLRNGETKFIELGNDAPTTWNGPERPKITRDDVHEAIAKVKQGYKPRPDLEVCAPAETGFHDAPLPETI